MTYYELPSIYGHDTFLLDVVAVGAAVKVGHVILKPTRNLGRGVIFEKMLDLCLIFLFCVCVSLGPHRDRSKDSRETQAASPKQKQQNTSLTSLVIINLPAHHPCTYSFHQGSTNFFHNHHSCFLPVMQLLTFSFQRSLHLTHFS